jgi:uncharacterized membrane protein YqjE
MARSATPEPAGGDQSLGDLVAVAAKDVSQLLRYEIELAKTELRADVRKIGLVGVLGGIAAFFACLILFSLCFAYAYGVDALRWPGGMWGAFLYVAATLAALGVLALYLAWLILRRLSRMRRTRESVSEGISMLRRQDGKASLGGTGPLDQESADGALAGGKPPEIAGRETG